MTSRYLPPEGKGYAAVVLDRPAPPGGVVVTLESLDLSICTVDPTLVLGEGMIAREFEIRWVGAGATQVRASLDGVEAFLEVYASGVEQGIRPAIEATVLEILPDARSAVAEPALAPVAQVAKSLLPSASADEELPQKPRPKVGLHLRPSLRYAGK